MCRKSVMTCDPVALVQWPVLVAALAGKGKARAVMNENLMPTTSKQADGNQCRLKTLDSRKGEQVHKCINYTE